jgi:hypothetical protein
LSSENSLQPTILYIAIFSGKTAKECIFYSYKRKHLMDSYVYIPPERLKDYAVSTARLLRPESRCSGLEAAALLRQSYGTIRRCHQSVERRYGALASPPTACQWLLDNYYMVQREYACAMSHVKTARHLRCCRDGIVIVELCRSLVHAGQGQVTEERCRIFLEGFQSVTVLQRRELELFPYALRCALIEAIADVCRYMQYAADTTGHGEALAALFTSLRLLSVLDMEKLLNNADVSSAILAKDPTGHYPNMAAATKAEYLKRLEKLARWQGMEEQKLAEKLIQQASLDGRHVGFYLYKNPPSFLPTAYISINILLPVIISLAIALSLGSILAPLLLLVPIWQLTKSMYPGWI